MQMSTFLQRGPLEWGHMYFKNVITALKSLEAFFFLNWYQNQLMSHIQEKITNSHWEICPRDY